MRATGIVLVVMMAVTRLAAADPVRREPIVDGVTVSVYAHELDTEHGRLPVWTYVSSGLWAKHQQELRITVKREPGEKATAYPRDVLDLYRAFATLADKGQHVDLGDWTELGRGVLGRKDLACLLLTPAHAFDGVPIEAPSLTALVVTCNEARAADHGYLRVMARLGREQRAYPTTPWIDRARAELIGAHGDDGSILVAHPPARVSMRARREGDKLVLLVLDSAIDEVKSLFQRAPDGGVPLALSFDPSADAYFVWSPGQKAPEAISRGSQGTAIGLNFLVMGGGATADSGALVEDGFVATFTATAWKRLRAALEHGKPLTLPLGKGSFEVRWIPTEAQTADGRTYVAPGGFNEYTPRTPAPPSTAPVATDSIVLLTPEDQLASMVDSDTFGAGLTRVIAAVAVEAATTPVKGKVDLMIELRADGSKNQFRLAFRPDAPHPFADRVQARLDKLPAIAVKKGTAVVQVNLRINGGTGAKF